MRRIYENHIETHFRTNKQMLFLVGPRQVGKTTLAKQQQKRYEESLYLNWDVVKDRAKILSGQEFIEGFFPLSVLREEKPLVIFDEIHKYRDWKNYLKGFYDKYADFFHILVTGSARLDIFQSGGDSLMGRYFQYRIHPFTVSELIGRESSKNDLFFPSELNEEAYNALHKFGGFPDPFIKKSEEFSRKWSSLRSKQLLYEDIKSISQVHEISQLEVLAFLLQEQTGQLINRTSLSKKVQVTVQTISRWIETLERFYFCFIVRPWHKNITRSLIKEPKLYLWDWSQIEDPGSRFENFVGSHLLKAVHYWNDAGYGEFGLYFLRDKDKRQVDFLVTKDRKPWMIAEIKKSDTKIAKSLYHFYEQARPEHTFQVLQDMKFVKRDCFEHSKPIVVPARTLLSQLV